MSTLTQRRGTRLAARRLPIMPTVPGIAILVNDNVSATSSGSGTVNAPAGRTAGDLLLLFRLYDNSTPTPNPQTGYTLQATNDAQGGFMNFRRIESRIATNTSSDNATWTNSIADLTDVTLLAAIRTPYRTLTQSSDAGTNFAGRTTATGFTSVDNSVAAPTGGVELVVALIHGNSAVPGVSIDTPSGYTLLGQQSYTVATGNSAGQPGLAAIFGKTFNTGGATGSTSFGVHLSSGSHPFTWWSKKVFLSP